MADDSVVVMKSWPVKAGIHGGIDRQGRDQASKDDFLYIRAREKGEMLEELDKKI